MKLTLRLFSLALILLTFSSGQPASAQADPPVLAFYYAWFDQNTWSSGQTVDLPAEPYTSADRGVIDRQVAQAQGAGIDAFVQAWYGPQEANNQTETNFRTLLDVAGGRGFKAATSFETTSPFLGSADSVTSALSTLLATHAQHPAYFRYQGKPVIFFWRQQQYSVDQWAAIRSQVDPNHTTLWLAEGTDLAYQSVFDGHYLFSIAWAGSPAAEQAKWGGRVHDWSAKNQTNRLWVATAMPGYNDTHLPRANAFAVARRDGAYYRETWQGALDSQPNMLVINSFNEWPEGSHIEPSATYGNLYLDLTREFVTTLRGSPPPAPAPAPAAVDTPTPAAVDTPDPAAVDTTTPAPVETPTGPYVNVTEGANIRSGPATTFERVGQLAAGSTIAVIGKTAAGDWWQVNFPRGSDNTAWVNAEIVEFVGASVTVPVVEAPAAPATLAATAPITTTPASVTIPAGGANVRSGPGQNFKSVGRLEEGATASVTGKDDSGQWWQIEYPAGENGLGWVAAAVVDFNGEAAAVALMPGPDRPTASPTVTPLPTATPSPTATLTPTPTAVIIAGTIEVTEPINVRGEPSTEGDLLGGLYRGDKADVLAVSQDGAWWLIDFPAGPQGQGWVNAEFVTFQGDQQAVPIFGLGTVTPTPGPTNTPKAPTPTNTPEPPAISELLPTLAPSATSVYQATASALLAERGTPNPELVIVPEPAPANNFSWGDLPWGLISLILIAAFLWYQFIYRRRRSS